MPRLVACSSCGAHVKGHESACPFCGAPRPEARGNATTAAGAVLVGLALTGCADKRDSDGGSEGTSGHEISGTSGSESTSAEGTGSGTTEGTTSWPDTGEAAYGVPDTGWEEAEGTTTDPTTTETTTTGPKFDVPPEDSTGGESGGESESGGVKLDL